MDVRTRPPKTPPPGRLDEQRLGAVGWGLSLVWIGLLFVLGLGAGAGFLGLGLITLAVQATRQYLGYAYEGFWIVVGLMFVTAAAWELLNPSLPLVSVLLILGGAAIVRAAVRGR